MRRALKARNGGGRFPGCTNHKSWTGTTLSTGPNGGESSLDNLVLLCRHHHHLVHEGGFDCKRSKAGDFYFEDRRDRRIDDFAEPMSVELEESMAWTYREFEDKNVSAVTPVAKWYAGEKMDWE